MLPAMTMTGIRHNSSDDRPPVAASRYRRPHRPTNATAADTQSAGLLVSAVRALATSASEEQRDLERQRLINGSQQTSRAIDMLVQTHQQDLQVCLSSFRQVSERVMNSRERLQNARNNIGACKSLLQCKRDELKQLWRENAEQRRVVEILERVDEIRSVTREVRTSLSRRLYLSAAQRLARTANTVDSDLANVEALKQIRVDVQQLSEDVYNKCIEELHIQLYVRPCLELQREQRSVSQGANALLARHQHALCAQANENDQPVCDENGRPTEHLIANKDQPPIQHIAVLCDALGALGRLHDALQELKSRAHSGLWYMAQAALKLSGPIDERVNDVNKLSSALQLMLRLFNTSVTLHAILLTQSRRVAVAHNVHKETSIYKADIIYHVIEAVLVQLLNDYLGISAAAAAYEIQLKSQQQNDQQNKVTGHDISNYFSKKSGMQRIALLVGSSNLANQQIFRLAQTSHALNVLQKNEESPQHHYIDENEPTMLTLSSAQSVWVCAPEPTNVSIVYKPLTKFANEIKSKMRKLSNASDNAAGDESELANFLDRFVKETFMPRMEQVFRDRADAIFQSSDMWTVLVTADEQLQLQAEVPVLASSAKTLLLCREVGGLIQSLPIISANLAALWLLFLTGYSQSTQRIYEQITRSGQPDGVDVAEWRKISAAWAVDEDISRLLKSLPNWANLVATPTTPIRTTSNMSRQIALSPPVVHTPGAESAEQIRERNRRESEILMSNLGAQKCIEQGEVITDLQHIKALATMNESLEWLGNQMRRQLRQLPSATLDMMRTNNVIFESGTTGERSAQEPLLTALEARLTGLQSMAATCLLMLHLEVRVHCFFYLIPLARTSTHVPTASQSQEADPRVQQLSMQLIKLHALLEKQLLPRKVKYVFEGLGHLVASIFMQGAGHIQRINDNGKKRMYRNIYSLQQTLAAITQQRESDLDRANRFFELLYKAPDQILDDLRDSTTPEFTELEYRHLVALAVRSHPQHANEPGALDRRLSRLSDIMRQKRTNK